MARTAFNLISVSHAIIGLFFAALGAQAGDLPTGSSQPVNKDSKFAKGKVCGSPFAVKEAYFDGRVLLLKTEHIPAHRSVYEDSSFTGIKVTFPTTEPTTSTSFYVITDKQEKMNANGQEQPRPELTLYYVENKDWFTTLKYNAKYTMTLRFFEPAQGLVAGHIDLKTDGSGTEVQGYFYARKGSIATPL